MVKSTDPQNEDFGMSWTDRFRASENVEDRRGYESKGLGGCDTFSGANLMAIPPWLQTMRDITGTKEVPGGADNPLILKWCNEIATKFPELAAYCKTYTHDSIPWCGLTVAYVMAHNGIRPIDGFLWAANWGKFGKRLEKPVPGCVMVFTRDGGGHVTLLERIEGDYFVCRGGNQADAVNESRYPKSRFTAAVWPTAIPMPASKPAAASAPRRFTNITATVFSGPADKLDNSISAYGGKTDHNKPGVALPFRFVGTRPKVRVYYGSRSVVCDIVDIGPWNVDDDYWNTSHGRPQAETGTDRRGRKTNLAGIDLTPAAARALLLAGKEKVDWEFVAGSSGGNAAGAGAAAAIVVGGVVGANEAKKAGHHPVMIGFGFALVIAIAVCGFLLVRKMMRK